MPLAFSAAFSLLAACTPEQQRYVPNTASARLEGTAFVAADGAALPLKEWPASDPRAIVLALHGFNDYSHAFEGLGSYLSAHGIDVYAYDQRGFGQAPGHGLWADGRNLARDAGDLLRLLAVAHPGKPIYLLGESMGGAVVLTTLAGDPALPVKGAILSAPAVWGASTMNLFYRSTLWLGAHTFPDATLTGRGLHILASDNLPMLRALGRDPNVIKATRIDAIYGLVGLMGRAYDAEPQVKAPILLLYGANDRVIPQKAIVESLPRFNAPLCFAYYDHGYHMLERDLESETVLADIAGWIRDPAAPLPSGMDKDALSRLKKEKPEEPPKLPPRWHHRPG